eukprot:SAG31_NODE_6604_length_1955_cov_1.174569_2_plen_203_part_00
MTLAWTSRQRQTKAEVCVASTLKATIAALNNCAFMIQLDTVVCRDVLRRAAARVIVISIPGSTFVVCVESIRALLASARPAARPVSVPDAFEVWKGAASPIKGGWTHLLEEGWHTELPCLLHSFGGIEKCGHTRSTQRSFVAACPQKLLDVVIGNSFCGRAAKTCKISTKKITDLRHLDQPFGTYSTTVASTYENSIASCRS